MTQTAQAPTQIHAQPPVSPLMLADRLISLAQDADRAGFARSATRLLGLAYAVFDEAPGGKRQAVERRRVGKQS